MLVKIGILMLGVIIGFSMEALLQVAGQADNDGRIIEVDEYKCKSVGDGWCKDMCCWCCPVAYDCNIKIKCKGNPGSCGQSVRGYEQV